MAISEIAPVGADWQCACGIWGKRSGRGDFVEQLSSVDQSLVQRTNLLSQKETAQLLAVPTTIPSFTTEELGTFCRQLHNNLQALYPEILQATRLETGFTASDCEEVVHGALDYVGGFPDYHSSALSMADGRMCYHDGRINRSIRFASAPWGTIAVILPQSAFLILAITAILNALYEGNRVIIRAPVQSARSAALLWSAVEGASGPADAVSVVLAPARLFLQAVCESQMPGMVHYLGSSGHAADIMGKCFDSGKHTIIDGEGNVWVYVDRDADPEMAARILTEGALRYNGQTCTSINGAILHPALYRSVVDRLTDRWHSITFGNPLTSDVQVGTLLDAKQAEFIVEQVTGSGAEILLGGTAEGNLLAPTLAAKPSMTSDLVTEGLFGAAMWIAEGTFDDFCQTWPTNRYPMCAGVLSNSITAQQLISKLDRAARICLNGDPSIEHIYEPWGGYPSTGNNPVSDWASKYQRTVQLDCPE